MADQDDVKTPKVSGTLQRAPIYAAMADSFASRLEAVYYEKTKILQKLDIKVALRCRELQAEAKRLAREFRSWESNDPGSDKRREEVMRLLNMESEVNELAPIKLSPG